MVVVSGSGGSLTVRRDCLVCSLCRTPSSCWRAACEGSGEVAIRRGLCVPEG